MKTFILAAIAASVLTAPVMAAPFDRNDRGHSEQRYDRRDDRGSSQRYDRDHRGYDQRAYAQRRWNRGDRFDSRYARNYRVISSPRSYRLHDAPRGYRWVQSGNDALLIGITTGVIASVLANAIN